MLNTVKIRLALRRGGGVDRRALPPVVSSQSSPGNDLIAKLAPHVAPTEKETQQRAAALHKPEDFLRQALPVGELCALPSSETSLSRCGARPMLLYSNGRKGDFWQVFAVDLSLLSTTTVKDPIYR